MNRYTQLTPSQFNPLSLQEVMYVPLMKRKQHDEANAQLEAQLSELDKIRALPVHTPEALEIKNNLTKKIEAQTDALLNQGFNANTLRDVLKTNREIKELFSPTGRAGQINAAYDTYYKNYDEFKKSNAEKKWSQNELDLNWGLHNNQYKGYDEQGNILNIDPLQAVEKVEAMDLLKDIKAVVGDSDIAYEIMKGGLGALQEGPDGSYYQIHTKTGMKRIDNTPQLAAGLKMISQEMFDPNGRWQTSERYRGSSGMKGLNQVLYGTQAMLDQTVGDEFDQTIQRWGMRNANEKLQDPAFDILLNESTMDSATASYGIDNYENFNTELERLKQLQQNGQMNNNDIIKYQRLLAIKDEVDNKLNNNEEYSSQFKKISQEEKEYESKKIIPFMKNLKSFDTSKMSDEELIKLYNSPGFSKRLVGDEKNKYSNLYNQNIKIQSEKNKLYNDVYDKTSLQSFEYSIDPLNVKANSQLNLDKENILGYVANAMNIENVLNLDGIVTTDGSVNKYNREVDSKDAKNIQQLMKGAKDVSMTYNFTNSTKTDPMVSFTFTPTEGAEEYITSNTNWSMKTNQKFGGAKKPVTVTFRLGEGSDAKIGSAPGYSNVKGKILDLIYKADQTNEITGNRKGNEAYTKALTNIYSKYSPEELKQLSKIDHHAKRYYDALSLIK